MAMNYGWFFWAIISACFAALTAIFAKIGIRGIDSDYATLIRTIVIIVVLTAWVWLTGKWRDPRELPSKSLIFLRCQHWRRAHPGSAISVPCKSAMPRWLLQWTSRVWCSWRYLHLPSWTNGLPRSSGWELRWWRLALSCFHCGDSGNPASR